MAKQKLELQVNIPTTIKLLQTEPATGENGYGKWYLYSVECSGQEYSYFAPEKVVNMFKENNVIQDDEVIITKKLTKNGKKNIVDYEVCVLESKVPVGSNNYSNGNTNGSSNGFAEKQNGQLTNNNGNGHIPQVAEFSKDYHVMLQCMTEAMCLKDVLGHDVDVNKLGITLFLRKVKP